jgi:hypothetical protein
MTRFNLLDAPLQTRVGVETEMENKSRIATKVKKAVNPLYSLLSAMPSLFDDTVTSYSPSNTKQQLKK